MDENGCEFWSASDFMPLKPSCCGPGGIRSEPRRGAAHRRAAAGDSRFQTFLGALLEQLAHLGSTGGRNEFGAAAIPSGYVRYSCRADAAGAMALRDPKRSWPRLPRCDAAFGFIDACDLG